MTCYYPVDKAKLYREALEGIGYETPKRISGKAGEEAFRDFVDAGRWGNLDMDTVDDMIAEGELTREDMAKQLYRIGHDC